MLSRELKIGIVGGLISSVLVIIFIQPILNFIWGAVLSFGESVQAGYVDRIYRNAAIGDRNIVGHFSLLLQLLLFNFIGAAFCIAEISRRNEVIGKLSRTFYLGTSLVALIGSCVLLIVVSLSSGVMEINASFNQRLTVMAPVISEQEYKQIKAQWATMRSQNDYRAVVASMEKRAADLHVQLPELRKP